MTKTNLYSWNHSRPINSYANFIKEKFGQRIQKISIDAGFTCPNRDGSKAFGGCSFCNNDSFMVEYANSKINTVAQQVVEGKLFIEKRYRRVHTYFAYFQAYTNTYADLETLKSIYNQVTQFPEIIGIIIGTRPDCVDDEKLAYFRELSKKYYVVLEYGLESVYDSTLTSINRQHTFAETVEAIHKTHEYGIHTGSHVILGLPGETSEQILRYTDELNKLPLHSLKLHHLQIVKGTKFAIDYKKNPESFNLFTPETYIPFVANFIAHLSPHIYLERLASETPKRVRIAPIWEGIKYETFVQMLEEYMIENELYQGKFFERK